MFAEKTYIFVYLILFFNFTLGIYVLWKNPKNKSSQVFFTISILAVIWITSNFFEDEIQNENLKELFLRIDYASGILGLSMFLFFCLSLVNSKCLERPLFFSFLFIIPSAIAYLSIFTNEIIIGYQNLGSAILPIRGRLGLLYDLVAIGYPLAGLTTISLRYRKMEEQDKFKIVYVYIGMILFITIVLLTNVVLIEIIKSSPHFKEYSRIGLYSISLFLLFSGYAIARHQLFSIKILMIELLALGVLLLSFFQIIRSDSLFEFILNFAAFLFILSFVLILVKNVYREVERKEDLQFLSDRLSLANAELRQLDRAKSEFISIASHQLRTPLTSIKGYSSLLIEGTYGELGDLQKEVVEKIFISNERLIHLVEDLLNISRIEAGKLEFNFEYCDIVNIVEEVIATFEIVAKKKGLRLVYERPKKIIPKIKIDGVKIKEIISNMIDNAIKYTPKGEVVVRIKKAYVIHERHGVMCQNEVVRVIVADTGIGIDHSELDLIFEKFSRGAQISRFNTEGIGLGMYVAKKVINVHKGRIWAESAGRGQGSRFVLELLVR